MRTGTLARRDGRLHESRLCIFLVAVTIMAALYPLKSLALDAHGLPVGHHVARESAITLFRVMANEALDFTNHFNQDDADWIGGQMILRYLSELERVQR